MKFEHLSSNLGLLGFALTSVFYLLAFQKIKYQKVLTKVAFTLLLAATISSTLALALVIQQTGFKAMSGLLLTSLLGWLAVIGHLRFNMKLMGAFVAPLATLILLIQFFVAPAGLAFPDTGGGAILVGIHVAMAIIGQAFAIMACAVSIVYLWQQNLLKKKLLTQLSQNLPAIDKLDSLLVGSLWGGFIFITLGLLSGAVYTQLFVPRALISLEFKVIWAIVIWLWYLATLLARNAFNRSGKRVAQMSLLGFMLLAVTYFGMGFFRHVGGA